MRGTWVAIKYKNEVVDPSLPETAPDKRRPVIYLWIRGEDRKRYRLRIKGFRPYFYLPLWFKSKAESFLEVPEIEKVKEESFPNGKYLRVFTYIPSQVRKLRQIIAKAFVQRVVKEADILFELRFLIDKKIRSSVEWTSEKDLRALDRDLGIPLRKCYLDLEVWTKRKITGKMRKDEYIKCISAYDSYNREYITWYYNEKDLGLKEEKDWKIVFCSSVEELVKSFLKWIVEKDPDVITGYNIDYDLMKLREESLRRGLGEELDSLSSLYDLGYRIGRPVWKKHRIRGVDWKRRGILIDGREVIDILDLIRMISPSQLPEYTLDYVSKKFVSKDEGKLKWNGKPIARHIQEVWKEDPLLVLRYNRKDVELCVELDAKNDLIDFLDHLRKAVGVRLTDALSQQRMIDTEALRRRTYPLPSKFRTKEEGKETYKGALVIEPKLGLHEWVVCLDWKSLYPSLIRTFNIDTDTFVRRKKGLKRENYYVLKNKEGTKEWWFKKSPRGLFPRMLDDFVSWREELKRKMARTKDQEERRLLNIKQNALKVLANATYGSFAYRSRKHSYEVAEAVTSMGQVMIEFASKVAQEKGFEVLYGDTDSIFVKSEADSYGEAYNQGIELQDEIIRRIPKFLRAFNRKGGKNYFYIKLEKIYSKFFLTSKKRYCGKVVTERGQVIDVKGLDTKRSDTSYFSQKLQRRIINIILGKKKTKEELIEEIAKEINSFDTKPLYEIGVPSAISKPLEGKGGYKTNPIQKKAAVFSNRYLNTKFRVGDKPKRVYVIPPKNKEEKIDVLAFDENTNFPSWVKIDYSKMIEKTVKPKIEKFLEALNIKWGEIEIRLKENLRPRKKKRKRKEKNLVTLDKFLGVKKSV